MTDGGGMNERFKELAEQSGSMKDNGYWNFTDTELQYFAELVRQDYLEDLSGQCMKTAVKAVEIEREAIAKMFEAKIWAYEKREIVAAIRARGNHGED